MRGGVGMFFILLYLEQMLEKKISELGAAKDDRIAKKRSIEDIKAGRWESGTWIDRKCIERDLVTDEPRFTRRINGDKVVTDCLGNVLYNVSQSKRDIELNKYREHNDNPFRTVVSCGKDAHRYDECKGVRYKEIATGREFAVRKIIYNDKVYEYFIDTTTGEYIRPTDGMYQMWDYYGTTESELNNARDAIKIMLNTRIDKFNNHRISNNHVEVCDYYDKSKLSSQNINF